MRAQIRGLNQDTQNVQNGKSLLRVAEGGIQSIIEEIRTLKELALNSANDTNTDLDRATIQKEFENRKANINDIATETNYNGKTLLDGRYGYTVARTGTTAGGVPDDSHITVDEPTGTPIMITSGDYPITANGVYMLANGYTGTVTIADGVTDVKIQQENSSVALNDVYIVGPSTGNANLWIEGLNIIHTDAAGGSIIKLSDDNNTLTIKGTNTLKSDVILTNFGLPVIDTGNSCVIESASGGTLNTDMAVNTEGENRVVIGGLDGASITFNHANVNVQINQKCYSTHACGIGTVRNGHVGTILIDGGNINVTANLLWTNGADIAGIGCNNNGGSHGRVDNITIKGGANVTAEGCGCAAIGGSAGSSASMGDILIDNSLVNAKNYDGGSAIGSAAWGKIDGDIKIGNRAQVTATCDKYGAAIGTGIGGEINDIVIGNGATISATVNETLLPSYASSPPEKIGKGVEGTMGNLIYTDLDLDDSPSSSSYTYTATEIVGNPLVIHHGTKANQALNVYINDMHTWSLKTDVPSYDDILEIGRLDTKKAAELQAVLDEAKDMTLDDAKVVTQHDANVALRVIDGALQYALDQVTTVGAYQSRLDFTESNLVTANENTVSSESTIRDADMAKEMTEYTKANVLAQAAQSMLAQANQNSSQIMSLLQ